MSLWIIPDILLPLKEYMKVQMRAVISHMIISFADIYIVYHTNCTIPIHCLDHVLESHNICLGSEFGINFPLLHSSWFFHKGWFTLFTIFHILRGEFLVLMIKSSNRGGVRATGAQDSRRILSNITDCGYDTTHLQENPQRLGWGSWRDVLYYILSLHSLCQG